MERKENQHVLRCTRVNDLGSSSDSTTRSTKFLDGLDNIISVGDLAENDVLAIEPAGDDSGDEELGTVCVRTSVGH